jgi:hypothetical protein
MRAPSQTGSSKRVTGPIADTSPHHLRTAQRPNPTRRVALVLVAAAVISVISSGVALLVFRPGNEEASADSTEKTPSVEVTHPTPAESDEAEKGKSAEPEAEPEPEPEPKPEAEPEPVPGESAVPPVVNAVPPTEAATGSTGATDSTDDSADPTTASSDDGEPVLVDDEEAQPKDNPWSKRPMYLMQTCVDRRARAQAALDARKWKDVLSATGVAACWSMAEQGVRRGMRVQAYLDLGEFEKCIASGRGVDDKQIRAAVKICEERRGR